jgi:hypothetical protein
MVFMLLTEAHWNSVIALSQSTYCVISIKLEVKGEIDTNIAIRAAVEVEAGQAVFVLVGEDSLRDLVVVGHGVEVELVDCVKSVGKHRQTLVVGTSSVKFGQGKVKVCAIDDFS